MSALRPPTPTFQRAQTSQVRALSAATRASLAAASSSASPAGAGAARRTRRAQYARSASTRARSFSETSPNCHCRKRHSSGSSSRATFPADFRGRARTEPAWKQRMCPAACSAPTRMTPTCAPTASIRPAHSACAKAARICEAFKQNRTFTKEGFLQRVYVYFILTLTSICCRTGLRDTAATIDLNASLAPRQK